MIFFSYTRIVAKISLIPLIIVGVIGYMAVKYGNTLAEGLVRAMIALAIWFGATFGIAAGIVTGIVVMRRKMARSAARATINSVYGLRTKQDIPVVDWTLKPAAIEPVKGVMINGIPIEEWQKQHP